MHTTEPGQLDQYGLPLPHRLMRFAFIVRVVLLTQGTWTVLFALFAEDTMLAHMISMGGRPASYIQLMMLCVVMVGWLDIFINDVLSRRFHFDWAKSRRHLGYSILGASYMMHSFVSAGSHINDGELLAWRYFTLGLVCAWYSWVAAWRPDHAM